MEFSLSEHPHRRYNPLTGEWVLVSPHRTQRAWRGQVEKPPPEERPAYEANCYLCPGNERAGGIRNPEYESTFVFTNDFSALLPDTPPARGEHPLLRYTSQQGTCRVVCFSPRHGLIAALGGRRGGDCAAGTALRQIGVEGGWQSRLSLRSIGLRQGSPRLPPERDHDPHAAGRIAFELAGRLLAWVR